MITLENINDFTLQEVFDQCVTHLLSQDKKCLRNSSEDTCSYRHVDEDGVITRCALGCFMSDSMYTPNFEGKGIYTITELFNIQKNSAFVPLLRDLQKVHDFTEPDDWAARLELVAYERNLIFKGA